MAGVQTFWCVPDGTWNLYLRRYARHGEGVTCEAGYHRAMVHVGREPSVMTDEGHWASIDPARFAGDPRWPTHCEGGCGYQFDPDEGDEDAWQVFTEAVYRTADGSTQQGRYEWEQRELPPGAMYDAQWSGWSGDDGIALVVVCPPAGYHFNQWHVDMPATGGGRWTRTGDPTASPPTVDVSPSIEIGFDFAADGSKVTNVASYYHGHLRHGVLVSV